MAEEKDAQRVYVVLRASADKTLFRYVGATAAHSAAAACRAAVEEEPGLADDDQEFIGIPLRTWMANRTTVKVERPVKVTTSSASS